MKRILALLLLLPLSAFGSQIIGGGGGGGGVSAASGITNGFTGAITFGNTGGLTLTNANPNLLIVRPSTNASSALQFRTVGKDDWIFGPDAAQTNDAFMIGSQNAQDLQAFYHEGLVIFGAGASGPSDGNLFKYNTYSPFMAITYGSAGSIGKFPLGLAGSGTNAVMHISQNGQEGGGQTPSSMFAAINFNQLWQLGSDLSAQSSTGFALVNLQTGGTNWVSTTSSNIFTLPLLVQGDLVVTGQTTLAGGGNAITNGWLGSGIVLSPSSAGLTVIAAGGNSFSAAAGFNTINNGIVFGSILNIAASTNIANSVLRSNTWFVSDAGTGAQSNTIPSSLTTAFTVSGQIDCFSKTDTTANAVLWDSGNAARVFSTSNTRYLNLATSNDCGCFVYFRNSNTAGQFLKIGGNISGQSIISNTSPAIGIGFTNTTSHIVAYQVNVNMSPTSGLTTTSVVDFVNVTVPKTSSCYKTGLTALADVEGQNLVMFASPGDALIITTNRSGGTFQTIGRIDQTGLGQ